jgi:hypothetical protein
MKCPSCGNEQAEGWLSCQRCHIIFARWKPGSAEAAGQPTSAAPTPGPTRQETMFAGPVPKVIRFQETAVQPPVRRPLSWVVYLVLILPFAVAMWLLINPKGRPVEPGYYRDKQNHFAIRAPEGWLTLTKENNDDIVRQYGAQIPAKLLQAMNSQGLAVSFLRLGQASKFASSLNVMIVKNMPPPITEKSKQEAAKAIAGGFASQFADYRQESVTIIEVDGIRSLEILSTASMGFQFPNETGSTTLYLRSHQVLVPGKNRAYLLTFVASRDASEDSDAAVLEAMQSFRVLKRPPLFGPVVNNALIGGMIIAIFFLLTGLLSSLGGAPVK